MAVHLTVEHEKIIDEQVSRGRYRNPQEALDRALRLLEEESLTTEQRTQRLLADLDAGLQQVDRGQVRAFDSADMKRRVREHVAEEHAGYDERGHSA